jgi:serine/threonine protein kinase
MESFRWSLENFSNEAEMLASLHHPGIVKVLRTFKAFGTAYFVMPFVAGLAFDELIRERRAARESFSEVELKGLLTRVLDAMSHLHERGIYHRDIKPDNIFLGVGFEPILIDLGSARWHGQNMSAERSATYSLYFSAIEQVSDRFGPIGPWTDIYQLSAVLYRCITGGKLPDAVDRVESDGDPYLPLVEIQEVTRAYPRQLLDAIDQGLEL